MLLLLNNCMKSLAKRSVLYVWLIWFYHWFFKIFKEYLGSRHTPLQCCSINRCSLRARFYGTFGSDLIATLFGVILILGKPEWLSGCEKALYYIELLLLIKTTLLEICTIRILLCDRLSGRGRLITTERIDRPDVILKCHLCEVDETDGHEDAHECLASERLLLRGCRWDVLETSIQGKEGEDSET
jgi:hypothetical protein